MDEKTRREIDVLKTQYMVRYPFWAPIIGDVEITISNTMNGCDLRQLTKVGATDGTRICFLPEWWEQSATGSRVTEFAHEAEHIIRGHHFRMRTRHPRVWNIATDDEINNHLDGDGHTIGADWILNKKYKGWEAEKIYADILKGGHPNVKVMKGGQGGGQDQPGGHGNGTVIDLSDPNAGEPSDHGVVMEPTNEDGSRMTDAQIKEGMEDLNGKIQNAAQVAKRIGNSNMADRLREISDATIQKRSWKEELRFAVSNTGDPICDTWTRLDRRPMAMRMWQPTIVREGVKWCVLLNDVSGSVGDHETMMFYSTIKQIRSQVKIQEMTIVPFNSEVLKESIVTLKPNTPPPKKVPAGGGTSIATAIDWVRKQKKKPDVVIILTDMEDYLSQIKKPDFPVIWASTTDPKSIGSKPSFGKIIHVC